MGVMKRIYVIFSILFILISGILVAPAKTEASFWGEFWTRLYYTDGYTCGGCNNYSSYYYGDGYNSTYYGGDY